MADGCRGAEKEAFWGSAACGAPHRADAAALQTADTGGDDGGLHCAGGIVPLAALFACACSRPSSPPTPPRPQKAAPSRLTSPAVIEATKPKPSGAAAPEGGYLFTRTNVTSETVASTTIAYIRCFRPSLYILQIKPPHIICIKTSSNM